MHFFLFNPLKITAYFCKIGTPFGKCSYSGHHQLELAGHCWFAGAEVIMSEGLWAPEKFSFISTS